MTDIEADLLMANAEIEILKKRVEYLEARPWNAVEIANRMVFLGTRFLLPKEFNGKPRKGEWCEVVGIDIRFRGPLIEYRDEDGFIHTIRFGKMKEILEAQKDALENEKQLEECK